MVKFWITACDNTHQRKVVFNKIIESTDNVEIAITEAKIDIPEDFWCNIVVTDPDNNHIPSSLDKYQVVANDELPAPPAEIIINLSDVPYSNPVLTAIMSKLKETFKDTIDKHVKVIEDAPTKWAIHTDEQYYYTVHETVKKIAINMGIVFKAASTGNPDWDVFCSA